WVAVTGTVTWTSIILYLTVALWTAGFDIIYACQDVEVDRKEGLHSVPARFGISRGLGIARMLHALTAAGFAALLVLTDLSWWYFAGTLVSAAILLYEHRLVKPDDLSRLNAAFFTMNGVLSAVVFIFTFIDLVVV